MQKYLLVLVITMFSNFSFVRRPSCSSCYWQFLNRNTTEDVNKLYCNFRCVSISTFGVYLSQSDSFIACKSDQFRNEIFFHSIFVPPDIRHFGFGRPNVLPLSTFDLLFLRSRASQCALRRRTSSRTCRRPSSGPTGSAFRRLKV